MFFSGKVWIILNVNAISILSARTTTKTRYKKNLLNQKGKRQKKRKEDNTIV